MSTIRMTFRRLFLSFLSVVAALFTGSALADPPAGILDDTHASVRAVMAVQEEVTSGWMNLNGVLGTAVGLDDNDQPSLVVFVDKDSATVADVIKMLPTQVRGVGGKGG